MESKGRLWNSNYLRMLFGNFSIFFSFWLLTPLLPIYLSDEFGANKETIGIVLSGYSVAALISRAISGYIVDSFPRKTILIIGFVAFSLFFGGYIIAGSLLLFAVVRTLHGIPLGMTTVANNTVAVDVLPPLRRTEGIGYYGLSNNVATAISPTFALWIYGFSQNYDVLFGLATAVALCGLIVVAGVKVPEYKHNEKREPLTFGKLFLVKGWSQSLCLIGYAFSYGVVATYVAIYGKEELGITGGTGLFFMLFSIGLILSRLVGSRTLRLGRVRFNAGIGSCIAMLGYLIFAAFHNKFGYFGSALVIGLGNGYMYPSFQSMLIEQAPVKMYGTANSTLLVSWDIGLGLGILIGGAIAEAFGYFSAFWVAGLVNVAGVLFFFLYSGNAYQKHRYLQPYDNKSLTPK